MRRWTLIPGALVLAVALSATAWSQDTPKPERFAPDGAAPEAEAQATPDVEDDAVEPPMSLDRLWEIVQALDPEAARGGTRMQLTVADVPILIVTDPFADRMRAMIPIRAANELSPEEMMRVLQANFDTALDARYAVANGRLWGVFIHPLSPLKRDQFISGLGQTINIALSYGKSYSGGAMVFGGGDEGARQRALLRDLLKKGEDI